MSKQEQKHYTQEPGDKPFPWRCPRCLTKTVKPATIRYSARATHDGRLHEFEIPELSIPKCESCGELVFSLRVDEQLGEAFRSHLRLLTPAQIRTGRKTLGLHQKELAERLGIAEATISRWETGSLIQSRAMDNLLRLYFAFPEVRSALSGPDQDAGLGREVQLARDI